MEHSSRRKSPVAAQAAIPIILKYDLLRNEELREAVLSTLSAGKNEHAAEGIKHARWDILQSLFRDYLTGRTTVISDVQAGTNLAKATVRRCLGVLQATGIVGIRSDRNDRRRRVVFLTHTYRKIVDRFVNDCAVEFKDRIELHGRRQSEKTEANTRAILNNALDAIVTIDTEGRIVEFNRSAERLFGYQASQVIGRRMADLIIPPTLRRRHNEAFGRHVRKGTGAVYGHRIDTTAMTANGQEIDIELTIMSIKDGKTELFTAFIRDITEQKRAEEALRESEERYQSVVENVADAIFVHDFDGQIVDANEKAWTSLGYSREELLSLGVLDFEQDYDRDSIDEVWEKLSSGAATVEGIHRRKNGTCFPVEVHLAPYGPPEQRLIIATVRDISERKRVEEALREAKEKAEYANGAKTEFLALMSHDLRTPLNAVLGFSEMMRINLFGPLGDPHYEEYAEDIHKSGTQLLTLIDAILDLSKIEAGKVELEEKAINMGALLRSLVDTITVEAEARRIVLKMDVPSDLPCLRGDERAMSRIFDNLLSNALKFTPKGGTIRVAAKVLKEGSMSISLIDTGRGMSGEDIAKVLKPFEQVGIEHSRKNEGTGLGLYICKRHVEMHNATLTITSEVGRGTAVTVRFPKERTIIA